MEVLDFIKKNKNVTKKKLLKNIPLNEEEINEILTNLQRELKIEIKDGYYEITENNNRKIGRMILTKNGNGLVDLLDKKIFVPRNYLNGAMDGDLVLIDILDDGANNYGIVRKRKVETKIGCASCMF